MWVKCPQCRRRVPSDLAFCPGCGATMPRRDAKYWNFGTPMHDIDQAASSARGRAFGLVTGIALFGSIVMVCLVAFSIGWDPSITGLVLAPSYLVIVIAGGSCAIVGRLPMLLVLSIAIVLITGTVFSLVLLPVILVAHFAPHAWGEGLFPEDRRRHLLMMLSLAGMIGQYLTLFWFLSSPMASW